MAVWAGTGICAVAGMSSDQPSGYSLSRQVVPEADLGPYIQQAIDQVRHQFVVCLNFRTNISLHSDQLCYWRSCDQ